MNPLFVDPDVTQATSAPDGMLYVLAYLAFVAWFSLLPVLTTRKYDPPYFWRWTLMLISSGPLLSALTLAGFLLSASSGEVYSTFMATGFFIVALIIPFQLLIAMTAYLFICSTLKERRMQQEGQSATPDIPNKSYDPHEPYIEPYHPEDDEKVA
jgi:hypothetical protein